MEPVLAPSRSRSRTVRTVAGLAAWAILLAAGFGLLASYAGTPGRAGAVAPAIELPGGPAAAGARVVVIAVHPRCPCTRASLVAARRTVERARREGVDCSLRVLARRPAEGGDWDGGGPDLLADLPPGILVVDDPGGGLADRFGAVTSGHVIAAVADETGRARTIFHGGVTPGRGHEPAEGWSPPLLETLLDPPAEARCTPVYGCPLARSRSGGRPA